MSRRSRRRKGTGNRLWVGKLAVGLLVVALLGLAVGYGVLRSYLHSDGFRKFLSAEASRAAGVSGEFGAFQWDGLAVDADSFAATGEGLVRALRADGMRTEVGLGGVRRGVWEIKGSSVRRLEISVDATRKVDPQEIQEERNRQETKRPKPSSWLPREAEVDGITVGELAVNAMLEQGLATVSGLRVTAEQAGAKGAYRAEIAGGRAQLPFHNIPELRVDRAQARYQDGRVYLTTARVEAWDHGRISATGDWDLRTRTFTLDGEANGLKCEDLLSESWARRLTGDVESSFVLDKRGSETTAAGDLVVRNGVLTALPMLDALAAYADTRRFRVLTLSDARTSWRWKKGEISLTNLVLASEGLVRLEGSITIRGQEMDGVFRLGLAPGTLSRIPGAETHVFLPGERGLLWAPLRITGSLDDPKEDLTERLVAAAGLRMFDLIPESGEKVLKFTQSVLGKPSQKTVEKGVKIIEQGSKTVREVGGILDGILGGGRRNEPENLGDE
jgi:hypothetical protein